MNLCLCSGALTQRTAAELRPAVTQAARRILLKPGGSLRETSPFSRVVSVWLSSVRVDASPSGQHIFHYSEPTKSVPSVKPSI